MTREMNRIRFSMVDMFVPAWVATPDYRPAACQRVTPESRYMVPRLATAIPPERWPVVAADARLLGLRQAAKQHGVSHETVRRIVCRLQPADS